MALWSTFNRRFNSSLGFRASLCAFVVTAIVFSVLPLLRYLRGYSIFDYELWYATGKHVLAGDEIYFFRAGKYRFHVSAALRTLSGEREFAWAGRIDSSPCRDQLGRLVLQRETECSSRRRPPRYNKPLALPHSEPAGDRLHLVELPHWPAQPRFTCANGWRFCCAAGKTRNRGRQPDCSRCRHLSIPGTCHHLSGLPALLEGSR